MGLTAAEDVGRSVAVGWQHPTVEICVEEVKKRRVGRRIRQSDFGPSDLDMWTVQIPSEDRNRGLQANAPIEKCDAIKRWPSI